ncbi:MAG: hypothetical protein B7C24_01910 [Bacteroidetes bacterium 4572_77]|nr:MAG: hypothetical protein B7C24_01910 [Bacteroidetes bacterium 4572_77]
MQKKQAAILNTYKDDFGKYAKETSFLHLQKIINAIPTLLGRKVVYSNIDNNVKSRELKSALELLELAGLVHRVKRSNGEGLPLEADVKDNYFKIMFLDVGLLQYLSKADKEVVMEGDLNSIFKGGISEQFVGQELVVAQPNYSKASLYYWARDKAGSSAEVDYIIPKDGQVLAVEVKSGHVNQMKSLWMFIKAYQSPYGIRIAQSPFEKTEKVMSIPNFALWAYLKEDQKAY